MTLQQLIDDLQRHLPHNKDLDVYISVPDRVGLYQADWAHVTIKGIEIVAVEASASRKRTALNR